MRIAPAKPIVFSLDDIVHTKADGSQAITDKGETDFDDEILSKNSRVTLLYLDPGDKFKVKIHNRQECG